MNQLRLNFSKRMQKTATKTDFPKRTERITKKKININNILKTAGGYPVRSLRLSTIQTKKSLKYVDWIVGQVLYYDDLLKCKVWINETWLVNGFHYDDYQDFDLIEVGKSDGIENQLHLF